MRWATPQLHDIDALSKMVDPALNGMYPAKSLSRFADIIALCVQVRFYMHNLSFGVYTFVYLSVGSLTDERSPKISDGRESQ